VRCNGVINTFKQKCGLFTLPLWSYVLVGFCPRGFCSTFPATTGCTASPPNMVCVIPCKTFFYFNWSAHRNVWAFALWAFVQILKAGNNNNKTPTCTATVSSFATQLQPGQNLHHFMYKISRAAITFHTYHRPNHPESCKLLLTHCEYPRRDGQAKLV